MHTLLATTTSLTAVAYANADDGTEFTTCLGRIVWGHPLKPQDKMKDNQKVIGDDGQPVKQWAFGVAFPKDEFQQHIWPHLYAEALKGYPNGPPRNFSYKYKDGDTDTDRNGNPLSQKEGYAGCFVLSFSTELQPPQCFIFQNNAYMQIDADKIKTGDYVQVGTNAKWHAGQSPALYVNPMTVLLCFEGDAIAGNFNADPNAMFGAQPSVAQMPQGARPVGAPAQQGQQAPSGSMPGMTQQPPAGGMPGNGGMPGAQQQGAPAQQPTTAPPPAQPPAPTGPQRPTDPTHVHDNGNGTEQWFVNGNWDGGSHPVPQAGGQPQMPPPATGFVDQAAQGGAAPQQQGMPGQPPAGGMPGQMPPR